MIPNKVLREWKEQYEYINCLLIVTEQTTLVLLYILLKNFTIVIPLRPLFTVLHSKSATVSTVYQGEDYVNDDIYTRLANC